MILVPCTDERAPQELGPNEGTKTRLGCLERVEDLTGGQFTSRLLEGPEQYECISEVNLGYLAATYQDSCIVSETI